MFSYRVWLTAGDLSPALGPSLALPAHPDEGQSPWTWDSRLLGGNKTAEVVSPCPQPSMLWKPTPHHQHRLEDTNKKCFKQTRRSPTYSRSEKSDVALQKVLVEISLFVVFFLNINLLQNFTWRSFIHIHTIFYRYIYIYKRFNCSKRYLRQKATRRTIYLSNMTTPVLQKWFIPILASSNSFPETLGRERKLGEGVASSPKTFP